TLDAAGAQALRGPGGDAEDDLGHGARHGVPLARGRDAEVLAHGRARARYRPEHDASFLVEHEVLRDRLIIDGVLVDDGEDLAGLEPETEERAAIRVLDEELVLRSARCAGRR